MNWISQPYRAIRDEVRHLRASNSGERFRDGFQRRSHRRFIMRALIASVGALLVLAGVVMTVAPGPGVIAIIVGIALISSVSSRAAHLLDIVEAFGWRMWNRLPQSWRDSRLFRVFGVLILIGGGAIASLFAYFVLYPLVEDYISIPGLS